MRCLSVCLSHSCILSKRINISSNFFSPLGSRTILVFPYQTSWQYFDGNSVTGTSNADRVCKNRDSNQYLASPHALNATISSCYQHGAAGLWQVVTVTAGSKWRSLLMAGDDYELHMTRKKPQCYAEDNRIEFNCMQ